MKSKYDFYFDEQKNLICHVQCLEVDMYIKNNQAKKMLKSFDRDDMNIKVFQNYIRISNESTSIKITDLKLFVKGHFDQYIPKLYKKIWEATKEYRRKEAMKKSKHNIKLGVTTGTIAITSLFLVGALSKNISDKQKETISKNSTEITLEQELEGENIHSLQMVNNIPDKELNNNLLEIVEPVKTISNENTYAFASGNNTHTVYLDFELSTDYKKKEQGLEYLEIAEWCSEKWGISSNAILMYLTQESAGREANLMQISWEQWEGKPIRVYNFRDNIYETFLLTNNPTEEEKFKYTCITEEDLKNPKTNISIGCILLRKSFEMMNYHFMAGLQCYNLGVGNMEKVFQKTFEETGQSKEEILMNQSNITFYDYTNIAGQGDPKYLSNVFAFMDEYGDTVTFKHLVNGEVVEENIQVFQQQKII